MRLPGLRHDLSNECSPRHSQAEAHGRETFCENAQSLPDASTGGTNMILGLHLARLHFTVHAER